MKSWRRPSNDRRWWAAAALAGTLLVSGTVTAAGATTTQGSLDAPDSELGPVANASVPREALGATLRERYLDVEPASLLQSLVSIPSEASDEGQDVAERLTANERVELPGAGLTLELFDGEVRHLEAVEVALNAPEGVKGVDAEHPAVSWIGQERDAEGQVVLSAAYTFLPIGGGQYQMAASISGAANPISIVPTEDGRHVLAELDGAKLPEHHPEGYEQLYAPPEDHDSAETQPDQPHGPEGELPANELEPPSQERGQIESPDGTPEGGGMAPMASAPGMGGTTGPTIDVMIGYATNVPYPSIREILMIQELEEMNLAFVNSNMLTRVRLRYIVNSGYTPVTGVIDTLALLRAPSDGHLDNMHAHRDGTRSDLVTFVQATGGGGVAYVPPTTGSQSYGFSAVTFDAFSLPVMAHELGHNMGGGHVYEHGTWNYSQGHYVEGIGRDIMSGSNHCTVCPELFQFSSPIVPFLGHPSVPSGIANQRDGRRTMMQLAPYIYEYRTLWSSQIDLGYGPGWSDPSATTWGPGHKEIFWQGAGNTLSHRWYNGTQWYGPASLGGTVYGKPKAVTANPGHLDVFYRSVNNEIRHQWFGGTWSGEQSLGGQAVSEPEAVSWGNNHVDLFWAGSDGNLWTRRHLTSTSWGPATSLGRPCPPTGCGAIQPRAVTWGVGNTTVFVRGTDGMLWRRSNGNQSGWGAWTSSAAGPIVGEFSPVSWGPNHMDIYYRSPTNQLRVLRWNNSTWQTPATVATMGTPGGAPQAMSWGINHVDVFWRNSSAQLRHYRYHDGRNSTATIGSSVGGTDPAPLSWGQDHMNVAWRALSPAGHMMLVQHEQ